MGPRHSSRHGSRNQPHGSPGRGKGGRGSGVPSRTNSRLKYGPHHLGPPRVSAEFGTGPFRHRNPTIRGGDPRASGNYQAREPEVRIVTTHPFCENPENIAYEAVYGANGELIENRNQTTNPHFRHDVPIVQMLADWALVRPGINREDYHPLILNNTDPTVSWGN
ncbi:hypothetical protein TWF718_002853 [Orbilia javanica]|uniref:Uncharacterized protein n=1 Tax=Orbilia javanica TaxID=47235 RepID=A0AAN8MGS3_9PEZI